MIKLSNVFSFRATALGDVPPTAILSSASLTALPLSSFSCFAVIHSSKP
jgi:hypothetical protein